MFSRLVGLRSLAPIQGFSRRFKSRGWADGGEHATHNDLPIPQGDWKERYSRLNVRNNIVLLTGIIALAASSYMLFLSGTVTYNFRRPNHYRDDDLECACEDEE